MKRNATGHTDSSDVIMIVGAVLTAVGLLALVNAWLVVAWVVR